MLTYSSDATFSAPDPLSKAQTLNTVKHGACLTPGSAGSAAGGSAPLFCSERREPFGRTRPGAPGRIVFRSKAYRFHIYARQVAQT